MFRFYTTRDRNFDNARIPTAQHFDIDVIKDTSSKLPHMFPSPETFAAEVYSGVIIFV
jgi:thiosulfate/3-mercaptopyruvate sulfurtransferase